MSKNNKLQKMSVSLMFPTPNNDFAQNHINELVELERRGVKMGFTQEDVDAIFANPKAHDIFLEALKIFTEQKEQNKVKVELNGVQKAIMSIFNIPHEAIKAKVEQTTKIIYLSRNTVEFWKNKIEINRDRDGYHCKETIVKDLLAYTETLIDEIKTNKTHILNNFLSELIAFRKKYASDCAGTIYGGNILNFSKTFVLKLKELCILS